MGETQGPPVVLATRNTPISTIKPTICARIWQWVSIIGNAAFIVAVALGGIVYSQFGLGFGERTYIIALLILLPILPALAIYGALQFTVWMIYPTLALYALAFFLDQHYLQGQYVLFLALFDIPNIVLVSLITMGSHKVDVGHAVTSSPVERENELPFGGGAPP